MSRKRRKKAKKKVDPVMRAMRLPLRPPTYCKRCEKMIPDIVRKPNGKFGRPNPKLIYCSSKCVREDQGVGGWRWIETRHPDLLHLFL